VKQRLAGKAGLALLALALIAGPVALEWRTASLRPASGDPVNRAAVRRVAVIAAMPSELEPFVEKVGSMTREELGNRPLYRGRVGSAEVLATRTGMGTDLATEVTDRVLDAFAVDHVIAIGIAGAVSGVEIGEVLTPALVINGDDGTRLVPSPPRGIASRGTLRTSRHFSVDARLIAELAGQGINAVDMETAAIGASAQRHGCTWSVYRAISDKPEDGLIDMDTFGLAHPDGSPDLWAAVRFIARRPWALPRLIRLGRDAQRAADAAAEAALRELREG
jgi:nucleoside phosphorylase